MDFSTGEIMIKLNGLVFVKDTDSVIESLFNPIDGKTAAGTYKRKPNGVLLSDLSGKPRVFLVDNKHNEQFAVSVSQNDGEIRYMNALCSIDEKWLALDGMGYMQEIETIRKALNK